MSTPTTARGALLRRAGTLLVTVDEAIAGRQLVRTTDDGRWVGVVGADCGLNGADLLVQKRIG